MKLVTSLSETQPEVGNRVYLRGNVAGEPGVITMISGAIATIHWPDLEIDSQHDLGALEPDASYQAHRAGLDFDERAA